MDENLEIMTDEIMAAVRRASEHEHTTGVMVIAASFTFGLLAAQLHQGDNVSKPECFEMALRFIKDKASVALSDG